MEHDNKVNVPFASPKRERETPSFVWGEKNWAGPLRGRIKKDGQVAGLFPQDPKGPRSKEEERKIPGVCVYLGAPNHHRCVHHFSPLLTHTHTHDWRLFKHEFPLLSLPSSQRKKVCSEKKPSGAIFASAIISVNVFLSANCSPSRQQETKKIQVGTQPKWHVVSFIMLCSFQRQRSCKILFLLSIIQSIFLQVRFF